MQDIIYSDNQSLMITNVISKLVMIKPEEIKNQMIEFTTYLNEKGYTLKSNPFYSTFQYEDTNEGDYIITLYVSVVEDYKNNLDSDKYIFYNSYLFLPRMLAVRVIGENEKEFNRAFYKLAKTLEENNLDESSPAFFFTRYIEDILYTDIYVAYNK